MPSETASISIDDAVLVRRCRHGDSAAMERLIVKYQNRIYNVILRICANPEDAAELTQDTFVKVMENIDRFEARSGFYTWAFRIAVNLTLNRCKRNARLGFHSLDADFDEYDGPAGGRLKTFLCDENAPDPAAAAQNREMYELAAKSLMRLDDDHRAVIVLRDIEDMSYARIAEVLGVELGTVKSRLARARKSLREIIEVFLR